MRTIINTLLSIILTLFLSQNASSQSETNTGEIKKIIDYGKEKLQAITEQNRQNDIAGVSFKNRYALVIDTKEALDGNDDSFDREYIKQRKLTQTTGEGSFFIEKAAELDKLDELLRKQNSQADIKTYLLFVDYVPMVYKKVLPASVTLGNLLQGGNEKDSLIAREALNTAATIVEGITQPFIDRNKGTKLLYCGFLEFKVFENSLAGRRSFKVYYPHNSVENGEMGNVYQTILANYIQSVKYNANDKVGYASNLIKALGQNNADYKTLLAIIDDGRFLQITSADEMEKLLKTVDANAFSGLPVQYRIHALKVLSGGEIRDNKEILINQLLETIRNGSDADEVITAMGILNDQVPDKIVPSPLRQEVIPIASLMPNPKKGLCLLQCIIKGIDDNKLVDFWHGDNYKRLINAFVWLCKLSPSFKAKADALNAPDNHLLPDRTIFYNYNNVWTKIEQTVFDMSMVPVAEPLKERTVELDKCQLTTQTKLFYSYFSSEKMADALTIEPFEPIVFVNNSDLGMLSDFGTKTTEKEWIVPAILLKYADDKAFTQSIADGSMAVIDIASMVTGYGEIKAGVTGMRKAWALFDAINGGVNLGLNTLNSPLTKEILMYYNLVTGGISLTRMGAGGVKNVYTFIKGKQVLQSAGIEGLLKAIKTGDAEALRAFSKEDIQKIEDFVKRIQQEAEARGLSNLKTQADGALEVINVAKTEGELAAIKNTVRFVDNYKVTSTGKIAEIISEDGSVLGTLYKRNQSTTLFYSYKYKLPNGNLKTFDKLVAKVENDFIEFDFNIPAELKGQGLGSSVFEDALNYYKIKTPNFKGIKGEWHGNNPSYTDGMSDNFKAFKDAKLANKTDEQAAFTTWTGKQAEKAGFSKAKVVIEDDKVLVEFTK